MNSVFSSMLVPVDASHASQLALTLGGRIASAHGSALHVCHAVDWVVATAEANVGANITDSRPVYTELEQDGNVRLRLAAETVKQLGAVATTHLLDGEPVEIVLDLASGLKSSLIVMGTHGRAGLERMYLGSTAESVLRRASIPVLTVREDTGIAPSGARSFSNVLVAIDGSEPSDAAIRAAIALPADDRARLIFCSVAEPRLAGAQSIVDRAVALARSHDVPSEGRALEGPLDTALLAEAHAQRADLILAGSHGRRGIERMLLGSVAERLIRTAPVPVLVVR